MIQDIVKTIKLRVPISDGDDVITELKFRKATLKDIGKIPMSPKRYEDLIPIAVSLSGQMTHVIEKLSIDDSWEVLSFLGEYLLPSQEIGEGQ